MKIAADIWSNKPLITTALSEPVTKFDFPNVTVSPDGKPFTIYDECWSSSRPDFGFKHEITFTFVRGTYWTFPYPIDLDAKTLANKNPWLLRAIDQWMKTIPEIIGHREGLWMFKGHFCLNQDFSYQVWGDFYPQADINLKEMKENQWIS